MAKLETSSKSDELSKSLSESFKSLSVVIQSAYELAPAVVVLLIALAIPIVFFTSFSTGLMKSTAVLLVLFVSLGIFIARSKFGEALLSFIGGLIAILRLDWTISLYVAFWSAWLGFSLFSLLISSIKLASKYQDIIIQSAVFISKDKNSIPSFESQIRSALNESKREKPCLKPIERAELARFFVFRRFPIDSLPNLICATEILFTLSKVDIHVIAQCIADMALTFKASSFTANDLADPIFLAMKTTCATPTEFFDAFGKSRKFLIAEFLNPTSFIEKLVELLDLGLVASEIYDELGKTYQVEIE